MTLHGRIINPLLFCIIFVVGLQERATSIQAWNFSTARSANVAITRTQYTATTTAEADAATTIISPTTFQTSSSTTSRRRLFLLIPPTLAAYTSLVLASPPPPAIARNMPVSTGADTSRVGTVSALLPLVALRTNLVSLRQALQEQRRNIVEGPLVVITKTKTALAFTKSKGIGGSSSDPVKIPIREEDFKRLFDAYSQQVSYKQKYLDQNAFLVYYTKGYDGPGRDSIEKDPVNERQTLQFGARNEAWIGWDDFLAEWEFYSSSTRRTTTASSDDVDDGFLDMIKYLSNTIQAVDSYLKLSPAEDLEAAQQEVSQ